MDTFDEIMAKAGGSGKKKDTFDEIMAKATPKKKESFDEIMAKAGSDPVTFYTADQVNDWMTASNAIGQKASQYYGVDGWVKPNDALVAELDNQLKEAPKVRQYFTANRAKFQTPDETIAQVDKLIEGLTALRDGGKSANDVFRKFDSAEAYNTAAKQSDYANKTVDELEPLKGSKDILFTTKDGQPVTGEQYYNTRVYLDRVDAYNAMTADKVKKEVLDRSHLKTLIDNAEARLKDHIRKYGTQLTEDEQAERNAIINDKRMLEEQYAQTMGGKAGVVYTTPEGVNITPERLLEQKEFEEDFEKLYADLSSRKDWAEKSKFNPYDENGVAAYSMDYTLVNNPTKELDVHTEMTPKELSVFNYLCHTQGEEAAFEWFESSLEPVLEVRYEQALARKILNGNGWTAAGASLASVGASLLSAVEFVGDAINYIGTGEMDTNRYSQVSSTVRRAVTQKYDWDLGGWDAFDFVYNTGMSMADSLATMPIGGWGSAAVLGLSAAASGTNAALERGLDDKSAFLTGVSAGVFETLFEKVSIGQFESMKDGITGGLKDAVLNVTKAMGVNASEELVTEVANIVYDTAVNGDLSEYETSIRAKMAQGMSEEDARNAVSTEFGLRVVEAAGSGALMGFGFGAGGSAISYAKTSKSGKAINNAGMGDAVIALGKTMEEGSKAQAFAMELDGKKNVSNADVGKLYGLISEQAQDMTPAQIFEKAKAARAAQEDNDYRVISQEKVGSVSEADVADFNAATGMKATSAEFTQAETELAQDQTALKETYAEREAGGVEYTPPKAKDIKAYSTADTEVYSRVLSREVYFYDGASHAQAEAGFAEGGKVYINKNAPVNRNSVAVVLAHEYTHTIEGTKAYTKLADTVFKSKGYAHMLATAGTNGELSLTHDEYLQQIIDDYDEGGAPLGETPEQKRAGAEKEAIAKYLSEYVLQSEDALIELARTDRSFFQEVYAQFRRFIARLQEKMPDKRELMKLESLFAKAAKAANTATQTQKSPADGSGVQRSLPSGTQYMMGDDIKSPTYEDLVSKGDIVIVDIGRNDEGVTYQQLKEVVLKKAEDEGLYNAPHFNRDTNVYIFLTKASYTHAFSNLTHSFGEDTLLALEHITEIIENAILTDVALPKNPNKPESRVFTLFGAIRGKNGVEPVKLTVKEYIEQDLGRLPKNIKEYFKNQRIVDEHYQLYDTKALEVVGIEKEFDASVNGTEAKLQAVTRDTSNPTIKIADFLELVNGDARKYIPKKINTQYALPSQSTLQVPSQDGDGGVGSADTQDGEAPRKPRLTKSQYIKRMLDDPTIGEATKARIRADDPLYEVLSDKVRYERASELAVDEDAIIAIAQKLENGEATTAEEITALTLVQAMSADGDAQAHAVYVTAMAARRAGQTLRSLRGEQRNYADMTPDERRKALIVDYKHDAGDSLLKLQNEFIDHKYHHGAGDYLCDFAARFESETGLADLSLDELNERVLKILDKTEDKKTTVADTKSGKMVEREMVNRVKGRIRYAFKSKQAGKVFQEYLKAGEAPIDAMRLTLNKTLGIELLTTSDIKIVLGFGETVGKMLNEWYNETDDAAAAQKMADILKKRRQMFEFVADHMTMDRYERVMAWRKFAMLFNVRTHVRNFVSNAAMWGVQRADDLTASLIEMGVSWASGDKSVMRHRVGWSATAHGKEIKSTVEKCAALEVLHMTEQLGYNQEASGNNGEAHPTPTVEMDRMEIGMMRKPFGKGDNALNIAYLFQNRTLEGADTIFYKLAFKSALGQRMVAQKVSEPTDVMIHEARKEALDAVFKGYNRLYEIISRFKQRVEKDTIDAQKKEKLIQEFADELIPFTKTPSNVVKSMKDHSVIGLVQAVGKLIEYRKGVKYGEQTVSIDEVVERFAKGLNGTALAVLGALLAHAGKLVVDEEDDWEYDELTGGTSFSLKFGDTYISVDWLQPAAGMFLMGAVIGDAFSGIDAEDSFWDGAGAVLAGLTDVFAESANFLFDQSYLKSLQDLFDTGFSQDGGLTVALFNFATSGIAQFIPTIFGHVARTVDPVQRKVKDSDSHLQTILNTVASRTPFASKLLEARTSVWGDDVMRNNAQDTAGGYLLNALQQFVLPSTVSSREYPGDATTEEMIALYDRLKASGGGAGSIFNANDMSEWATADGHLLEDDKDAYRQMDRYLRQAFKGGADRLVTSDAWDNWSDEEKAKQLGKMYENIRKAAKEMLEEETVEQTISNTGDYADTLSTSEDVFGNLNLMAMKLSDGTFLVYNSFLAGQYESAVQSRYDALWKEVKNKREYTFSLDGVKYTIDVARASDEEMALVKRKTRERAEDHIKKLYKKADVAELEASLRSGDGHHAYEKLKSTLND